MNKYSEIGMMKDTEKFHMLADKPRKNGLCCKTCIHRPILTDYGVKPPKKGPLMNDVGFCDPDDMTCPFLCGDPYYNYIPDDDFFCAYWEKKHETD